MTIHAYILTGTGKKYFFPVQLTTSRVGNLTRLILTLAICDTLAVNPLTTRLRDEDYDDPELR